MFSVLFAMQSPGEQAKGVDLLGEMVPTQLQVVVGGLGAKVRREA